MPGHSVLTQRHPQNCRRGRTEPQLGPHAEKFCRSMVILIPEHQRETDRNTRQAERSWHEYHWDAGEVTQTNTTAVVKQKNVLVVDERLTVSLSRRRQLAVCSRSAATKALLPTVDSLTGSTTRRLVLVEWSGCCPGKSST